jgi:chaperonin GroEL (HSP60 family)
MQSIESIDSFMTYLLSVRRNVLPTSVNKFGGAQCFTHLFLGSRLHPHRSELGALLRESAVIASNTTTTTTTTSFHSFLVLLEYFFTTHTMSRLSDISPNAEIVSKTQARAVNVAAGVGLLNVLKSNLGPRGTLKLLVGGAGQLKLTKDGLVLLKEMQIQHPTACLIARTATAQDDVTGDGTTSTVLLCGELLRQADRHVSEGLHPRILVEGLEVAREEALKYLTTLKVEFGDEMVENRELLHSIALTSLATKLELDMANILADAVVSAVQTVYTNPQEPIDLNRIEVMPMARKMGAESRFVNGIVLDHGARHPDMPDVLYNCKIMTCNVSLEYEKTETQSGFYYSSAEEREKLVESERTWLDERCRLVIDFKRTVCKEGEVSSHKYSILIVYTRRDVLVGITSCMTTTSLTRFLFSSFRPWC